MSSDLTLWGRKNSANVRKVLWTLAELNLSYGHIPLGGSFKGLDDPAYLVLNPNGKVPTLRDGAIVVWDSHAIVRYLAASYGAGWLWREDPRERAIVDQWTEWAATTFQPAWIAVFWNVVRMPKARRDDKLIASSVAATLAALRILDAQLAGRDYVAGTFSYADIVIGAAMYRWFTMQIERPSLPNLEAWYALLSQRPAFQQAIMVSYAELVGRSVF
ncbi:glutathione S-transferase family protein [Devosia sp.]|uniref:glutathione S-transferase family protein n=1 Tax=Devosia sp. TaxID=1871048 RepID=UPI0032641C2A